MSVSGDSLAFSQVFLFGGILFLCAALQSAVGFAFSLVALPLLLLAADLPLPQVVALALLASAYQRLLAVHSLRAAIDWRHILPLIIVGILALPVGLWILRLVSGQSRSVIRQAVGALVLAATAFWIWARPTPRAHVHVGWGVLAAFASGVLSGMANIGGPPFILWVHSHDWSNERLRVTLMAFSLPMVPVQFLLLWLTFGAPIIVSLLLSILLLPAILAGAWAGLRLGRVVSVPLLRRMVLLLLGILGMASLFQPMFARS